MAKAKPEVRVATVIRLPKSLLQKIDELAERRRRELGATWSRNDEIVAMLSAKVGEGSK